MVGEETTPGAYLVRENPFPQEIANINHLSYPEDDILNSGSQYLRYLFHCAF